MPQDLHNGLHRMVYMFRSRPGGHSGTDLATGSMALGCDASGRLPADLLQLTSPRDAPTSLPGARRKR